MGPLEATFKEFPEAAKIFMDLPHESRLKLAELFIELIWHGMGDTEFMHGSDRLAVMSRVDWIVRNLGCFSKQVDDREDSYMKSLKKFGLSIGQIAFVLGRSKSTIHAHL